MPESGLALAGGGGAPGLGNVSACAIFPTPGPSTKPPRGCALSAAGAPRLPPETLLPPPLPISEFASRDRCDAADAWERALPGWLWLAGADGGRGGARRRAPELPLPLAMELPKPVPKPLAMELPKPLPKPLSPLLASLRGLRGDVSGGVCAIGRPELPGRGDGRPRADEPRGLRGGAG